MSDDTDVENTFIFDRDQSTATTTPKKTLLWGRFVSTSTDFKNVDFIENELWFGRGKDLTENAKFPDKRMSSKHFRVFLEDGQPYVEDSSSNGTFLNGKKLVKGNKEALKNGDEVTFFSAKQEAGVPTFVFQDKRKEGNQKSVIITQPAQSAAPVPKEPTVPQAAPVVAAADDGPPLPLPAQNDSSGKRKVEDDGVATDQPPAKKPALEPEDNDEMEKNFTCGICQDIIYKCVSLMPCLHSFCCSCISDWYERSRECPECRKEIEGVNKPHMVQNMIDAYLAKNPAKKRTPAEMAALDPKSDINKLADLVKQRFRPAAHGVQDDDDDSDSDSSSDDQPLPLHLAPPPFFNPFFNPQPPMFLPIPPVQRCRQCPPGDGNPFMCPPHGLHLICSACGRNMPDRTGAPNVTQRCDICHRIYCHLYWGCTAFGAANNFKKLGDFEFLQVPAGPRGALFGNDIERQILVDYLHAKAITPTDCFKSCTGKLDTGEFKFTGPSMTPNITSQSHACLHCATGVFSELTFEYMKAIPKNDLPGTAGARPDCYYGKNCRTQKHNDQHRLRYNHVCEQTKN